MASAIKYNITTVVENSRYRLTFNFFLPRLSVHRVLNFRIHRITYYSGRRQSDGTIENSTHSRTVSKTDFDKMMSITFDFDVEKLNTINTIIFGFCDELYTWHRETFVTVTIDSSKMLQERIQRLHKIASDTPKTGRKRICILSSWNIKCGISQYCKNLYDALVRKDYEVTVMEHTINYDTMVDTIISSGCDIFLVQYEASLVKNIIGLVKCIETIKKANPNIKIYFTIHSENPALHQVNGKIDGFICHKQPKMRFDQSKVLMVPMGVPVFDPTGDKVLYRNKYGIGTDKFVVSTVGFMFKWKNHTGFLTHMLPYLKAHDDLVVQLLTSLHSLNNECSQVSEKIKTIIRQNHLENRVIHITDFIPQAELNERLYLSDVGFLWAEIETTSSSASLKEFVSSRLPLVKTNSSHHHDLNTGCITTEKNMPQFVNSIMTLYNSRDTLDKLRADMSQHYEVTNYDRTIAYYMEIFNG